MNSILYSAFSASMCISILQYILPVIVHTQNTQSFINLLSAVTNSTPQDGMWRLIFHLSKFYEYLDIVLVLWSGGSIGLHFGFHHLTTPYLTYARTVYKPDGWQVFAVFNAFHHAIMYGYFAGATSLGGILPITGYLQLIVGIMVELAYIQWNEGGILWPNVLSVTLLSSYAVLFTRDLRDRNDKGGRGE
ncbi:hypothetical protein BDQ17DRAFT_1547958 [Cyathus striatus]|nr:hypothetical protein BDQ17DRAFT_1547958 [Cyathus striatus]